MGDADEAGRKAAKAPRARKRHRGIKAAHETSTSDPLHQQNTIVFPRQKAFNIPQRRRANVLEKLSRPN